MPSPRSTFTGLCAAENLPCSNPADEWFTDRQLRVPRSPAARTELFATHAWGLAHIHTDESGDFDLADWDSLPAGDRSRLLAACVNRHARSSDPPEVASAKYLACVSSPIKARAALTRRRPPPPPDRAGARSVRRRLAQGPSSGSPRDAGETEDAPDDGEQDEDAVDSEVGSQDAEVGSPGSSDDPGISPVPSDDDAALSDESFTPSTGQRRRRSLTEARTLPAPRPALALRPPSGHRASHPLTQGGGGPGRGRPPPSLSGSPAEPTYDEYWRMLGSKLRAIFDNSGSWSLKERNAFVAKAQNATGPASRMAHSSREPEWTWQIDLLQLIPESTGRIAQLGERIATAARFERASKDPLAFDSRAPADRALHLSWWARLCAAAHDGPPVPTFVLTPVQNVVRGYFRLRLRTLSPRLRQRGLDMVIPHLQRQFRDLGTLLAEEERALNNRVLRAGSHAPVIWNTAWLQLLSPFFRAILGAESVQADTANVMSAQAIIAAGLAHLPSQSLGPAYLPAPLIPQPAAAQAHFVVPALPARPARLAPATAPAPHAAPVPAPLFLGLPASPFIIGPALAVWGGPSRSCGCAVAGPHASWECPLAYAKRFGPCPGFDAQGQRDPSDWAGNDLTPFAVAAWKVYKARYNLKQAKSAPGVPF